MSDATTDLIEQLTAGLTLTLPVDLACVLAVDLNHKALRALAIADRQRGAHAQAFSRAIMGSEQPLQFPFARTTGLLANVLRTREPIIERPTARIAQLEGGELLARGAAAVEAQTITLFPLVESGKRLGLLMLFWQRPPAPQNKQMPRLLEVFGGQLTTALRNRQEIARLRQSEAQSRARERLYEKVVNIAGNGMFLLDYQGRIVFANTQIKRMLGYTDAELLGRAFRDLIHSTERHQDNGQGAKPETVSLEKHLIRSDDTTLAVMVTYVPPPERDKNVKDMVIVTDMTDLKDREIALMQRTRQLTAINQAAQVIAASLDYESIPSTILAQTVQVIGALAGSILLVDDETHDLVFRAVVGPGGNSLLDVRVPMGQGVVGWIAERGEPTLVADARQDERFYSNIDASTGLETHSLIGIPMQIKRKVIGVLEVINKYEGEFNEEDLALMNTLGQWAAVAIDNARLFSELRDYANELEEAYEELKRIDQIKDEMIQNVSHELRTPLMHIISYVDMILEGYFGDLTPEQTESLTVTRKKAGHLNHLISEIVTLQELSDDVKLDRSWVQLAELAQQATTSAKMTAMETNATVELISPNEPLAEVYVDQHRMTQVLDNLIMNALKFSPEGGRVLVQIADEGDHVQVMVSDQGIGIAPEQIEHIFRRFYQGDGSTTRRYAGLGLGLAICQEIVEAHGGEIWLESEGVAGEGTRAFVKIPRATEGSVAAGARG